MYLRDLQTFISLLESHQELVRITAEVDPVLEIAAITDRICKTAGRGTALLFERPLASRFPVATNLFGSLRRVCLSLNVPTPDVLTGRMAQLLDPIPELDLKRLDHQISAVPEFSYFSPFVRSEPDPGLATMAVPDLTVFPFLQSWPQDGSAEGYSRYITLPQVFTAAADGQNPNCGMYRVQVRGTDSLAIRWKPGSGAARHFEEFSRIGRPMPVAIVLGGPPATTFSAMLPLPGDLDEMAFAGFLRGNPLETAPCGTVPLQVPIGAELVIEGYAEAESMVLEGPFGNHTGFYAAAEPAAFVRVTSVRYRPDAVIPATVVGPPPMEDCFMAKAWERILLAFLQKFISHVVEIHFPMEWIFHQSAIISLENPAPGMVREIAELLWSTPWFSAARLLVFVDADTEPADLSQVAWRSINLADFSHGFICHTDGKRLALDATGSSQALRQITPDNAIAEQIARRWQDYGLS